MGGDVHHDIALFGMSLRKTLKGHIKLKNIIFNISNINPIFIDFWDGGGGGDISILSFIFAAWSFEIREQRKEKDYFHIHPQYFTR